MQGWDSVTSPRDISSTQHASKLPRSQSIPNDATATRADVATTAHFPPSPASLLRATAPSLQAICLTLLANHLQELIEYGDDVLPRLPVAAKATLMAVARRQQGLLTDASLLLFTDQEMVSLDVSTFYIGDKPIVPTSVTVSGLIAAADQMPNLKYVDLTGMAVNARFLTNLAQFCPKVEVLRMGKTWETNVEAVGRALERILPQLDRPDESSLLIESWEDVSEDETFHKLQYRLMNLRCVAWPEIPHDVLAYCREYAPAVLVNPRTTVEAQRWRVPPLEVPLDAAALAAVPGLEARLVRELERDMSGNKDELQPVVVHIAEKFKAAYEEREARLRVVEERKRKKEAKQRERSLGKAEKAIRDWELEM